jgi:hypothetical protein
VLSPDGTTDRAAVLSPTGPDGGSPQRTRLAWRRTSLAHTGCALLLLRLAAGADPPWLAAGAAALTVAGWLAATLLSHRRITLMAARVPAVAGRALPLYALLVAGYALLGTALVALD